MKFTPTSTPTSTPTNAEPQSFKGDGVRFKFADGTVTHVTTPLPASTDTESPDPRFSGKINR